MPQLCSIAPKKTRNNFQISTKSPQSCPTGPRTIRISIVIPCLNEAESLPGLATAISPWQEIPGLELLFIDDGSQDDTGKLAAQLFPQARVISHPRNLGIGAALRTGTLAAQGDLIGWFDSDATYDPALLPSMIKALEESKATAVTLSPWHPAGRVEGVSGIRAVPSRVVSRLYRLLAPGRLFTYTAMVRLHRREAILAALPTRAGFPGVTESLLRILLQGGKVIEVPACLHRRTTGLSKMRFFRVIIGHLALMTALIRGKLKEN